MAIRDDFIEEIKEGDYVELVYGQSIKMAGFVIKLTSGMVRIKVDENSSPRISLDSIISYDTPTVPVSISSEPDNIVGEPKTEMEEHAAVLATIPLDDAVMPDDADIADLKIFKSYITDETVFRLAESIISKFLNMKRDVSYSVEDARDKLHDIRAEVFKVLKNADGNSCDKINAIFASMCYLMGDFERAEDYYKEAGCWSCAYYSAYRNGRADAMKLYIAAYIEDPDIFDRYMYRMYADMAADDKSVSALEKRFAELRASDDNPESIKKEVSYIAECLERIALKGGFEYKRSEDEGDFAFSERAFSEIALVWSGKTQVFPELVKKDNVGSAERFVSTIVLFNIYDNNAYGYIRNYEQTGKDHYFNIRQVNDDLLRKVLAVGECYKNLEVSFVLGMPFDPTQEPSADDVKLTDRGRNEAEKRLEKVLNVSDGGEDTQGNIDRFSPYTMFGKIDASGSLHDFRIENVTDINLLAYLLDGYKESDFASVMFRHKVHTNGKNIALNIRLNDKDIQVSEETVQRLINSGDITKEDVKRCSGNSDMFIDTDRLLGFPYEPLEPYIPEIVLEPAKEVKTAVVEPVKTSVIEDAPVSFTVYKHLPKLEPIDISGHTNIFASLEPLVGRYYLKAREFLLNKKLTEAEELFIKAIRAKDSLASAVSDLVGLYLQDSERVLDAIDLIAVYGNALDPKVRINHLASIYCKRSDRPFMIRSCHVFEEAASLAPDNGKKMHHIYFQVRALYLLGEYQTALDSARKWSDMYEMEVRYKKTLAVSKYASFLYGIRRFETFCYYWLGNKDKASDLAGELMKLNSSDELVRAVAENTVNEEMMRKSSGLIQNSGTEIDSVVEDEQDTEDVEIPGYTEYILEQTKIGDIFRDSRIVDNKYTGTPVQASKLIDEYKNREGKTSKSRSDILFCSAKVIYDVLEKNEPNIEKRITKAAAKNYIGRGFALLGDADICSESCNQQDTPRYCYIQTIRMLSRRERLESDLNRALVNYIDSFFVGKYELAKTIKSRSSQTPKVDWGIFTKKPLVTNEFVIGMTDLYDALKFGSNVQREFIGAMEKSDECQKLILQWFSENTDLAGGDITSLFTAGCIEADKEIGALEKILDGIPNTILAGRFLENALNGISDFLKVSKWLCSEDRKRTERFRNALKRMNSYNESNDFQVRVNAVDNILSEFDKLRVDISEYPTMFSYDVLLGVLDRSILEITRARNELYSEQYVPDIKFEYTVPAYIDSDNHVRVHLTIYNEGNKRQAADISGISVDKLPDAECIQAEVERVDLRGGESREFLFQFDVSQQVKNIGSFTPTFVCVYGYSKGPADYTTDTASFSYPVVFHIGDFEPITNVFMGDDGNTVKDEKMFFGRDDYIKELISELERPDGNFNYGHGVYLYGQTRAGKSSILHHFGLQLKEYYKDKGKKVILVDIGNIDGRVISDSDTEPFSNESKLLMAIIRKFRDEVEKCHPDLRSLIADVDEEYDTDLMSKYPKRARTYFDNYLSDIEPYIRGDADNVQRMIVITMDEFSAIHTAIKKNAFEDDFMKYWKSILQNYPVYTLIVGQDDMPQFVSDHQNEFACMRGSKVTYLDEDSCKRLMNEPILRIPKDPDTTRYIGNSRDKLYKLTSGSAFLTVKLCKFMVEYLNSKRAAVITPAIIDGFLREKIFCSGKSSEIVEADFEPQIKDRGDETIGDENKRLLIEIARRQDSEGWAEIDMLCPEGITDERKRQLLLRLKERDVILIRENKYCSIVVGMLTEWLLSQYGKEGKVEL